MRVIFIIFVIMVEIYFDGACRGNGQETNIGGAGFVAVQDNKAIHTHVEARQNTTNNREELWGLIRALKYLKDNNLKNISVYGDSQYCITGASVWMHKWSKNNWKKKKEDVKNADLWKKVYYLYNETSPNLIWIKSHQNKNNWNDYIDSKINEDLDFN